MQHENTPNYFETLGIEPTRDGKAIREAFKALIRKHHTDKGGDPEKVKAIIEAHTQLLDPHKLERCYQLYARNPTPQTTPQTTPEATVQAEPPPENANLSGVVPNGVRVTIYVPLFIHLKKWLKGQEYEYAHAPEPEGDYYDAHMTYRNFVDPANIDFEKIAEKLTTQSRQGSMQVGVDPEEITNIVNQHSYYKHAMGAYAVCVEVLLSVIGERQSEASKHLGKLNAKSGSYFWLDQGTQFSAAHIKSIKLAIVNIESPVYVPDKGWTPLLRYADRNTITAARRLLQTQPSPASPAAITHTPNATTADFFVDKKARPIFERALGKLQNSPRVHSQLNTGQLCDVMCQIFAEYAKPAFFESHGYCNSARAALERLASIRAGLTQLPEKDACAILSKFLTLEVVEIMKVQEEYKENYNDGTFGKLISGMRNLLDGWAATAAVRRQNVAATLPPLHHQRSP